MVKQVPRVVGVLALLFGLVTIRAGGNVLFGDGSSHEGAVVPFVLWFNFLAGFAYVAAGVGLILRRRWGAGLAFALALATALVFVAFGVHVAHGAAYAKQTVGALIVRTSFWALAAAAGYFTLVRPRAGAIR